MPELPWIDWALLALLGVSVVVGLVRGFVFEVMSLAGWLVAWFGAQYLARDLAPHLPVGTPGSAGNMAAAFVLCFVGILIVWALLAKLVRLLVHATPLSHARPPAGRRLRPAARRRAAAGAGHRGGADAGGAVGAWQRSEGARWLGWRCSA
jgi:membrane protein required for colicin V production